MKYLNCVIVILVLTSCSWDGKKSVDLDFAEAEIRIPDYYKETDLEDYTANTSEDKGKNEAIKSNTKVLHQFSSESVLYVSKDTATNTIWFQQSQYARITDFLVKDVIQSLEEYVALEYKGLPVNILQKELITGNQVKFIKFKYQVNYSGYNHFITRYIITGNNKTIGIVVNRSDQKDHEDIFKQIEFE